MFAPFSFLVCCMWHLLPVNVLHAHAANPAPAQLNWDNLPLQAALRIWADATGHNVLIHPDIQGHIHLQLRHQNWEGVLETVLSYGQLGCRKIGTVWHIAPLSVWQQRDQTQRASQTIGTQIVALRHRMAQELLVSIEKNRKHWFSENGHIVADTETNSLHVRDIPERLAALLRWIRHNDQPACHVQIEARFVSMKTQTRRQLGLHWQLHGAGGLLAGRWRLSLPFPEWGNAPGANAASDSHGMHLDAQLAALESTHQARILSAPHILARNHREAIIEQGQEIPFQQSNRYGGTTTAFKKAVLKLKVKPHITRAHQVVLQLEIDNDGKSTDVVAHVPLINTHRMSTEVVLDNRQTLVLGGIYRVGQSDAQNRIPFLGSLPVLRYLFGNRNRFHEQEEILVFLTPTVIPARL